MSSWFTIAAREEKAKIASIDGSPRNEAGRRVGEVAIHGPIADSDFWGEKVAKASDFIAALKDLGEVDEIELSIHSPGGVVTEGWAIHNALRQHSARVTARIEGLAASMASVVAMAADSVEMPRNSYLMIHNVSGGAYGNVKDLERSAKTLQQLQDDITRAYAERTGLEFDRVAELMDEETWMNGEQAHELGFADFVLDDVKAAAMSQRDLQAFARIGTSVPVQLVINATDDAEPNPKLFADEEPEPTDEPTGGDQEPVGADEAPAVDPEPEPVEGEGAADAENTEDTQPQSGDVSGDQEPEAADKDGEPAVDPEPENATKRQGIAGLMASLKSRLTGGDGTAKPTNINDGKAVVTAEAFAALESKLSDLQREHDGLQDEVLALSVECGEAEETLRNCLRDFAPQVHDAIDPDECTVSDLAEALAGEVKQVHEIAAELVAEKQGLTWDEADAQLPCPISGAQAFDSIDEEIAAKREELAGETDPKRKRQLAQELKELRNQR